MELNAEPFQDDDVEEIHTAKSSRTVPARVLEYSPFTCVCYKNNLHDVEVLVKAIHTAAILPDLLGSPNTDGRLLFQIVLAHSTAATGSFEANRTQPGAKSSPCD
jgi:hypothetical protein